MRPCEGRRTVNPHAAGVAMGAHAILACVPDGDDQPLVRACGTSPAAREALADGRSARGRQTGARASTGVEWMPRCAPREARGIPGCLSSAQAVTPVPGRPSDVRDCQGMHTVHRSGVLTAALRPDAARVALRTLFRPRAPLIEHRAPHGLHLQQALLQRPSQLSPARSNVPGAPGPPIIRALVAGERAPQPLAAWRHSRCKQEAHAIALAVTGTWREEPLFVLPHALARCDCSTAQLSACAAQIARACSGLPPRVAPVPAVSRSAATPPAASHAARPPSDRACGPHPRPPPPQHGRGPGSRPGHQRFPRTDDARRDGHRQEPMAR